jgi:mRNA-degrading endonuclease RelE of RelBE toxin-antitoxin system
VIGETKRFLKELQKMPQRIQKAWHQAKQKIAITLVNSGLDFKLWSRTRNEKIYSMRLSKNYRAHLAYIAMDNAWEARSIGPHKAMGHG